MALTIFLVSVGLGGPGEEARLQSCGHESRAVDRAADLVVGDEPFAVILADDLIDAERSVVRQLMAVRLESASESPNDPTRVAFTITGALRLGS